MKTTSNYNKIYLKSGGIIVTKKPLIISTVLGSCVSIILYSKAKKISAMSHALLPEPNPETLSCSANCPRDCSENSNTITNANKYITCSFRFMIEMLNKQGVYTDELIAAVYGGASLFNDIESGFKIGLRNVEKAKLILKEHKIETVNNHVLGKHSRTIYHFSDTGITYIKSRNIIHGSLKGVKPFDREKYNKTKFIM